MNEASREGNPAFHRRSRGTAQWKAHIICVEPRYHSTEPTDGGASANARVAHANTEKVPARNGKRSQRRPAHASSTKRPCASTTTTTAGTVSSTTASVGRRAPAAQTQPERVCDQRRTTQRHAKPSRGEPHPTFVRPANRGKYAETNYFPPRDYTPHPARLREFPRGAWFVVRLGNDFSILGVAVLRARPCAQFILHCRRVVRDAARFCFSSERA
jgi:hypothetical protein